MKTWRVWFARGDMKHWEPVPAETADEAVQSFPKRRRQFITRVSEIVRWSSRG